MRRFFVSAVGQGIAAGQRLDSLDEIATLEFESRNLLLLFIDLVAHFQDCLILVGQSGFEFVDALFVMHDREVGFQLIAWIS